MRIVGRMKGGTEAWKVKYQEEEWRRREVKEEQEGVEKEEKKKGKGITPSARLNSLLDHSIRKQNNT